jgi:cobalt transporter subunit CbtB
MNETVGTLQRSVTSRAAVAPAALLALRVGAFLVFGAGFAGSEALHQAAHDARHTINTPCH